MENAARKLHEKLKNQSKEKPISQPRELEECTV
jgi:hypothetical protein